MTMWVKESSSPHAATWTLYAPLTAAQTGWGRAKLAWVEQIPISQNKFYATVYGIDDVGERVRFKTLEEAKAYCESLSALERAS